MRYAVGLGAVLLVVGALYVLVRGTTRPAPDAGVEPLPDALPDGVSTDVLAEPALAEVR
jgi:hypothetical protein